MTELQRILHQLSSTADCRILPQSGLPSVRDHERLPEDLKQFYELCGGVYLFERATYPMRIVGSGDFTRSNPEIVGEECPDDISDSWYIVGRGGREEAISIDCNEQRLGRCYDSFWDRHAVAGDCRIVALSFTELLQRLVSAAGGYWYWLGDAGLAYGDAYDNR